MGKGVSSPPLQHRLPSHCPDALRTKGLARVATRQSRRLGVKARTDDWRILCTFFRSSGKCALAGVITRLDTVLLLNYPLCADQLLGTVKVLWLQQ